MKNLVALLIIAVITALIIRYLIREKKQGAVCVGCPYAGICSGGCHSLDDFKSESIKKE